MDSKVKFPEFAEIDQLIRQARIEQSVYVGTAIAKLVHRAVRGLQHAAQAMQRGYDAELDRRAIEADTFLKRSVSHY